jgi:hypothetical protein
MIHKLPSEQHDPALSDVPIPEESCRIQDNTYNLTHSSHSNMKILALAGTFLLLTLILLVAGCTQPTPTPPATPTPTPVPTTVITPVPPTSPGGMGTPGPTQTLPPEYGLTFQVTPNSRTTNPLTYVGLNGGAGMNFVTEIEIILTEPDGTKHTEVWIPPFSMGQNVGIPCSVTQNRVEIWTTAPTVGKIKVYDEIVPFKV